jgi:Angiotensin-converting enzyme
MAHSYYPQQKCRFLIAACLCVSELTIIMARSRDWDELQYVWFEWRRRTGQKIRDLFEQMAHVSNKAAQLNSEFTFVFPITRIHQSYFY